MAGTEDQTRNEYLKDLADREQKVAEGIAAIVKDNKGSAKDRNELVKQGRALQKSHRTLGGDLTKNVQDMKDGISTTVDGMINETFGPLGGVLSTFTTGWFKRAKENKDGVSATEATLEAAESNLEEIRGGKVETKAGLGSLESEQKKTTKAVQGGRETAEEEEKEDDKQHKELIDALKGLKVESVKDIGDDGGFFAGLGTIASVLGGIAMGLTAPGIFTNMSQWAKAFDNFKVKFPKFSGKIGGWWDDLAGSFKKFKFPDMPKFPKINWPDFPKFKLPDLPKLPDFPKMPEFPKLTKFVKEFLNIPAKELDATRDALRVVKAADYGFDGVRIASETFGDTTKLVARNAQGRFVKVSAELQDAMKLADPVGQGVIARAQKFMGIELPGFMQKSITKIDDVVKGADVAVDASKLGGLASKVGGIAKFLTVGVAGRALSIAGNPVFDVIAMGKDVFDIASAVTDDDVKSAVKNEDIGALVGGFIGGAIGIIGGPAGVALGMGLGNMAGEFIGKAMDDPEIIGAIKQVQDNLTAEHKALADEILAIEAEIKAATTPMEAARLDAQKQKLVARQTEVATELEEFTNKDSELNKQKTALLEIEAKANKINAEKAALELKMEEAEARGDSAMVARLQNRVTILDEEFDKADADYQKQAEVLRKTASKTSGALADQTNSFFDKMVTEGGFFGSILGSVSQVATLWGGEGLGMKGEGGKKYLAEAMKKIEGQISEQQALIDAGDDFDWALEPRAAIIAKLERERTRLSSVEVEGAAKGAVIVNRPTYLPSSGVVVGEHASWSGGKGAAKGGVETGIPDGGPEAIVPLGSDRAGAFFKPIARLMGEELNAQMYAKIGLGGPAGMGSAPTNIVDSSTVQNVTNNTIIRTPSPSGPSLHFEGRDFVHKIA